MIGIILCPPPLQAIILNSSYSPQRHTTADAKIDMVGCKYIQYCNDQTDFRSHIRHNSCSPQRHTNPDSKTICTKQILSSLEDRSPQRPTILHANRNLFAHRERNQQKYTKAEYEASQYYTVLRQHYKVLRQYYTVLRQYYTVLLQYYKVLRQYYKARLMTRHLQCAEQQVSPSNLTKYCPCHTE